MDQLSRHRTSDSLHSLQTEVNRLFEDLFPGREGNGSRSGREQMMWAPQLDVLETEASYRVRVDLPGVSHENVTINVENNWITIRGERQEMATETNETVLRTERGRGGFYRSLILPTEIDADKATANFEGGVLLIELPKVAKSKAKSISIS
jgi:HSP20 family protein